MKGKWLFTWRLFTVALFVTALCLALFRLLNQKADTGLSKVIDSSSKCSHNVLKHYYMRDKYFPSAGTWDEEDHFHPDICTLATRDLTSEDVCFPQRNLSYIVTIGDSNARRQFDALVDHARTAYAECGKVRREKLLDGGFVPEKEYFARDDPDLVKFMKTRKRKCHSCASRKFRCHGTCDNNTSSGSGWNNGRQPGHVSHQLIIEHIAMPLMLDTSLTVSYPHPKYTETFQEYIFKHYLTDVRPDFIIIFPPFNHMKHTGLLTEQKLAINHVVDLVKRYQKSNRVFWMPCTAEIEENKAEKWQNNEIDGQGSSTRIKTLNKYLFGKLYRKLIGNQAHNFGFFDLHRWTFMKKKLNLDGVHFKTEWYSRIMNAFIQVFATLYSRTFGSTS